MLAHAQQVKTVIGELKKIMVEYKMLRNRLKCFATLKERKLNGWVQTSIIWQKHHGPDLKYKKIYNDKDKNLSLK